jgi:hypothetical protein
MMSETRLEWIGHNKRWKIDKERMRIGREASCDIALTDQAMVSRQHVEITSGPEGIVLADLGSANGTFVNGKQVDRASLKVDDVIRLGPDGPELCLVVAAAQAAGAGTKVKPPTEAPVNTGATIISDKPKTKENEMTTPVRTVANAELDLSIIEKKLNTMRALLFVAVTAIVVLLGALIYQNDQISRTRDSVEQARREAKTAVAQFTPELDQRLTRLETQMDGMDAKMKVAEDRFVERMNREVPAAMDRYVKGKMNEAKGQYEGVR